MKKLEYFSLSGEIVPEEMNEEFAKDMTTAEKNIQYVECPIDLLYVRNKQYGLSSIIKNGKNKPFFLFFKKFSLDPNSHSDEFDFFLNFLGDRLSKEGVVQTKVSRNLNIHFFVSSMMTMVFFPFFFLI